MKLIALCLALLLPLVGCEPFQRMPRAELEKALGVEKAEALTPDDIRAKEGQKQ